MANPPAQVLRWDLHNRRRLATGRPPVPPTIIDSSFISHTRVDMDYVRIAIDREIDAWRIRSFDNFLVSVTAEAPTTAGPVYEVKNPMGAFIGYDTYVFEWRGTEHGQAKTMQKTMGVRMSLNQSIRVKYRGRWSPITYFLKDLEVPYREIVPNKQRAYDIQRDWWKANAKAFKFMELPSELRDLVYQFGFGSRVEPYPTSKTRRIGGNLVALEAIKARKPTSGLLALNRQIAAEASHILYLYTPFYIEHAGIFCRLMGNVHTRQLLRRLQLALPHDDLLQLFRHKYIPGSRPDNSVAAAIIPRLRLSRLELTFAAPPSQKTAGDLPCQRSKVGLILDAARPWVRGQPVMASGYIKDRQKQVFEAACLVERKRFELWQQRNAAVGMPKGTLPQYHDWLRWEEQEEDGGVSLTGKPRFVEEKVQARDYDAVPVSCQCDPPCTLESWVADD